ncbi:hypothetical protein JTB14_037149 [Gonioctena quinquepunctata]|nr:hypothetical protein JTB14_037149 [Gonioctena quinquepunctata]
MFRSSPKLSNLDESFKDIPPTPNGAKLVNKKVNRQKAINYKAQKVKKHLFQRICRSASHIKTTRTFYFEAIRVLVLFDMRHRKTNAYVAVLHVPKYYHEECVGLTPDDEEDFECPSCS